MVRFSGKSFRLGEKIRLASGSLQVRPELVPARAAHLAKNPSTPSVSAQETRYPHEMDTGLKSLATCERALLEVLDAALNERLELVAGGELGDVLVEARTGALRVTHLAQDATIGAGNALDSQD